MLFKKFLGTTLAFTFILIAVFLPLGEKGVASAATVDYDNESECLNNGNYWHDDTCYEKENEKLRAQVSSLLDRINNLLDILEGQVGIEEPATGGDVPAVCERVTFDRPLSVGTEGKDVLCLQTMLNRDLEKPIATSGPGSPGEETSYFGSITKGGVATFQEKYREGVLAPWDLQQGTGYVGSTTKKKLNKLLGRWKEDEEEKKATTTEQATTTATTTEQATTTATTTASTSLSAVTDLSIVDTTTFSIQFSWTTSKVTVANGTATYDVRYSTSTIATSSWDSATRVENVPAVGKASSTESITIDNLEEDTTYYFAVRIKDGEGNTSAISNVVSGETGTYYWGGGGGTTDTTDSSDTTAPSSVDDLSGSVQTADSVDLSWTAPGADEDVGTSSSYDLRYSTTTITADNWSSATQAVGEPTPSVAGSSESMTVTGLSASTTYYFAITAVDNAGNESDLSNVPNVKTLSDKPNEITGLSVSSSTCSQAVLNWTAPGADEDVGTSSSYDLRYSTTTITADNWSSATEATGEPTPSVAGSSESMTVNNLSYSSTYHFAIKASDESGNTSNLSNVPQHAPEDCSDEVASGYQYYSVNTDTQPKISAVEIDPLDVTFGNSQTVTVTITDNNPVSNVSGTVNLDCSSKSFNLSLNQGNKTAGYWQGSWTLDDSYCSDYQLTISASSDSGQSSVTLTIR